MRSTAMFAIGLLTGLPLFPQGMDFVSQGPLLVASPSGEDAPVRISEASLDTKSAEAWFEVENLGDDFVGHVTVLLSAVQGGHTLGGFQAGVETSIAPGSSANLIVSTDHGLLFELQSSAEAFSSPVEWVITPQTVTTEAGRTWTSSLMAHSGFTMAGEASTKGNQPPTDAPGDGDDTSCLSLCIRAARACGQTYNPNTDACRQTICLQNLSSGGTYPAACTCSFTCRGAEACC